MANWITVARFPLLIAIVALLYLGNPVVQVVCAALILLLIAMDSLDGIIARARNEVSLLGSVLDIMADRSVEQVMWVVYAHLGLIPVAIPIIFILRGIVVDSLRAIHVGEGQAPFKATQTPIGQWLVGSPWMRSSYGFVKAFAFTGLAVTQALQTWATSNIVSQGTASTVWLIFRIMSWIAVAFCLTRGIPVIVESFAWLMAKDRTKKHGA